MRSEVCKSFGARCNICSPLGMLCRRSFIRKEKPAVQDSTSNSDPYHALMLNSNRQSADSGIKGCALHSLP